MSINAKLQNPISIRIGNQENVLIEKDGNYVPLTPGIMFGGEHFGFVLIVDFNGNQREVIYPTQCTIQAVGLRNGELSVFEDGKSEAWRFDKAGRIIESAVDKFTDDYLTKADIVIRNEDMFLDKPMLLNPVRILISTNPSKSVILSSDVISLDYPLYPGAMLGDLHYGFVIVRQGDDGEVETAYPTQNRLDAVGIENGYMGDLKIFESGKYHPWLFTYDGQFKEQSSYEPFSRRDQAYINSDYDLLEGKGHFQLQKKMDK